MKITKCTHPIWTVNKVYHQSKQQCSSTTKMYYGDFVFVFSRSYISLVLCNLVRWNLQKNYPEYIAISSLHKTDNVNMTFLGTSKIPWMIKWLKSYTDPSLASKKSSSSPLLKSNSSHVFFPTARVQQLTLLLPHCSSPTAHTSSSPLFESDSSHVFFPTARVQQLTCLLPHCSSPTAHTSSSPPLESDSSHVFFPTARVQQLTRLFPHCSSPTAHTSSSALLESNSSHVFFPTTRVQQLTRLLPHCSSPTAHTSSSPLLSPTAHLKESQSSEWCCN